MNAIKATFVKAHTIEHNNRVEVYAVEVGDKYYHGQRIDQISYPAYVKLIKKNHPEYVFDEEPAVEIMTPPVPQAEHPHKEELSKSFDIDEEHDKASKAYALKEQEDELKDSFKIDDMPPFAPNVDEATGEITEDSPLKTEPVMETTTEAPKVEQKKKVSLARKAKWYGACGLGLGVRSITVPTHTVLQTASDVLHLAAVGVRNTEAFAIDKLKVTTATRDEIKGRIDQRTAKIQSVLMMPVTIPVGIVQSARQAMKSPIVEAQPA